VSPAQVVGTLLTLLRSDIWHCSRTRSGDASYAKEIRPPTPVEDRLGLDREQLAVDPHERLVIRGGQEVGAPVIPSGLEIPLDRPEADVGDGDEFAVGSQRTVVEYEPGTNRPRWAFIPKRSGQPPLER
jgi:hypothetical protein